VEYFTLSAYLHFVTPVSGLLALTQRYREEPTDMSGLKFPYRALVSDLLGAFFYRPARTAFAGDRVLESEKK